VDRDQAPFTALINELKNPPNSSHNIIWAICKDRRDALWIGTENGLFRRRRDEAGQLHVNYFLNDPTEILSSENKINVIYEDHAGTLWFGMDRGLMQFVYPASPSERFNEKAGQFKRWVDDAQNPSGLSRLQIFSICEEPMAPNTFWIGTSGGLFRLIRNAHGQNRITVFKNDPNNPSSLSSNNIRPVYVDRSGVLWVGTWHDGLNQFDKASERFKRFVHDPKNPHSLSNNVIRSIYEDRAGRLWVGTDDGFDEFDRATEQFRHYTESNGLPNNTIWGILEDARGRLWLSTNNGISRFDASAGSAFKNYTVRDGLSHPEFNRGAWFKSSDGEMFFGGMNGVTAFHPDSIKDNSFVPPVVITAFKRYNTDDANGVAIVEKGISARQEIKLSYKDNIISFEFAALNFHNPEKNQYAYNLEGYREQWIQLGTKREVTFTNLDPGEYVLRVKGSNNDGVWNEEGASFKIIITPPWWKTWWFRMGGVLAILGLIISAHRFRTAYIEARNRALEKEAAERKQAEMELKNSREQLRALTGHLHDAMERERVSISQDTHDELGGVLTALKIDLTLLERGLEKNTATKEDEPSLKEIRAMKQTIDVTIGKLRAFVRRLRPDVLDDLGLVAALEWQMQEFHKRVGVGYEFKSEATALEVEENCALAVFRIFQEALTNIVRHANAGKVVVQINQNREYALITIIDNGLGIPAEKLAASDTFGLLGMRERALMFGGEVEIVSAPGEGTTVSIKVPLAR
jgi:signal transduction histidine kinase